MTQPRILIISHGHPDFSLGGGEIAAHTEWTELRRRGIQAMFLARTGAAGGHIGTPFYAVSHDNLEYLIAISSANHFRHSQPDGPIVFRHFRELLEKFRPTAIHFHHYVHLGLEFIREARRLGPEIPITITLHEFLAICHAQGQMVKTNGILCRKSSPLDCHACFPEITPQDFFMRELFVKSFLNLADHFVCPSRFLCERYVEWGLPAEKMVVIENGMRRPADPEAAKFSDDVLACRFAVLGQLSRLKGTPVLLDAVRLLPKAVREKVRIEVHGSVQYAGEEFKTQLANSMKGIEDTVRLCGPYLREDVFAILRRNGWLIVPSIWWENSPVVIQEAFAARRPVICSNVGGMAEKIVDGVSGFHFRVNSAADLAARIEQCAGRPELWRSICSGVPQPPTVEETVDHLLRLYGAKTSAGNATPATNTHA